MGGLSSTITARYYKGMAAAGDNAVVEITSKETIPCKLAKVDRGGFLSMNDAKLNPNTENVASTVTARYYKGIGGNGDNAIVERVPCRLNKVDDNGDFVSMSEARIWDTGIEVAHAVTQRYYKGVGANNDNMVLEVSQPGPSCAAVCDFRYDEGLRLRKELVSPTISAHLGNGGGGGRLSSRNREKDSRSEGERP